MSATTIPVSAATRPGGGGQSFARRLWRGPLRDPAWARPALFGLLLVTGVLYLFNLSRNGYANDFYAAAVQAGTRSWKAFFFGSFDSSNFITVDKTPASLWVDEIAARIFGFSSWTLLVPQALEGIASVAVLYAAVRRWFGPGAGLVAGAVLALTPAAALMFRFNNPDALLVLLMTAAAYCVQRAIERDRTRWLVLAGRAARVRLPDQDGAGVPCAARVRDRVPVGRAGAVQAAAVAGRGARLVGRARGRLVGGDRAAVAGVVAAVLRRVDEQQHP